MKKVCVVVGVGPGNGASLSRRFAQDDYTVVMLARNGDYLDELAEGIPGSIGLVCDVTDPTAIRSAFAQVRQTVGDVAVLIYNAGPGHWSTPLETSTEALYTAWAINTQGLLVAAQQVLPAMIAKGEGHLMVIGATASLRGGAQFTAFASAKAAQRSLAQSLARDVGPKGIHVGYLIIDGMIDMPRTREFFPDKPPQFFMQPDAIADSVMALVEQDRSAWTFELDLRPFAERW
ncbi:MAG: SDR family NAD(P)-dependent oxidoreductase [Myxococcota bacterium]|nr:SDR family NAD(P)-dependent oxidoreductase [Myxococcota bacterium]